MNRRRLAAVVVTAALAGGLGSAHVASADVLDDGVDLRSAKGYWACVAVDTIQVGTCLHNPLPNPNDWGQPPV